MPAGDLRLEEARLLDRPLAGGVDTLQDAVLRPGQVGMGVKAGIEEGHRHPPPGVLRSGLDEAGDRQQAGILRRVDRIGREQLLVERGPAALRPDCPGGFEGALRAGPG